MAEKRRYAIATVNGTHVNIPIIKAGETNFAVGADWTPATGDVKVTKDDGTPANIGTLPTYVTDQGWEFVFTAAELTCKKLDVLVTDAATKAIEDQKVTIVTFGNILAMFPEGGADQYPNGFVTVDADASNTNTVIGIDGTPENPVSTLAAAITLADQLGKKIGVKGQFTSVTGVVLTDYEIIGLTANAEIQNNQLDPIFLNDAIVTNMKLFGDFFMTEETKMYNCTLAGVSSVSNVGSGLQGRCYNSVIEDINQIPEAGVLRLYDCYGTRPSPTLIAARLDFNGTSGDDVLHLVNFNGFLAVNDMNDSSMRLEVFSNGATSLNVTGTDGITALHGVGNFTDNTSGSAVVDLTEWQELPIVASLGLIEYPEGAIHFNKIASNTNTVLGVDGTSDNPVSTWAAAETLSIALGTKKINIKGSIDITTDCEGFTFIGEAPLSSPNNNRVRNMFAGVKFFSNYLVNVEYNSVNTAVINTGSIFENCKILGSSILGGIYKNCEWAASDYDISFNTHIIGGTVEYGSPNILEFDILGFAGNLYVTGLSTEKFKLVNVDTSDTVGFNNCGGILEIDASCTAGTITVIGDMKITDNSAGSTVDLSLNGLQNWTGTDLIGAGASMIESDGGANKRWTAKALEEAADTQFKKNVALANFPIFMVLSSDHVTPATGLTVGVEVQQDDGTFTATGASAIEIGNGVYRVNLTAAEVNGDIINLVCTAGTADTRLISFPTN